METLIKHTFKMISKIDYSLAEKGENPQIKSNTIKSIDVVFSKDFTDAVAEVISNGTDRLSFYKDGSFINHNRIGSIDPELYEKDNSSFKPQAATNPDTPAIEFTNINFLSDKRKAKRKLNYQINIVPAVPCKDHPYNVSVAILLQVGSTRGKKTTTYYKDITKFFATKTLVEVFNVE